MTDSSFLSRRRLLQAGGAFGLAVAGGSVTAARLPPRPVARPARW